jgi:hypothetical protein
VKRSLQSPTAAAFGLALIAVGAAAVLAAGYWRWGGGPDWYAVRDVENLWSSPHDDLIIYGYQLITNTQRDLGPHLRAGLQPYAAPFVSTDTSFPMQRTSLADFAVNCSEFTASTQGDPHVRSPSANWHRASFH